MIASVLHGIWRWCPLHQLLAKLDLPASFRNGPPPVEANYNAGANGQSTREGSIRDGESTLLPMLIAGLVAVVVGIAVAAFFV